MDSQLAWVDYPGFMNYTDHADESDFSEPTFKDIAAYVTIMPASYWPSAASSAHSYWNPDVQRSPSATN